jgi:hypothetical protein
MPCDQMERMIPLSYMSIEQRIALLVVCVFFLGFLADRLLIWFYHNYVEIDEDEEDIFEEYESWQEAI